MKKYFMLLWAAVPAGVFGQDRAPLISGTARFSVEQGTVECDITLSELPPTDDYVIRLNTGLNILNILNARGEPFILGYTRSLTDTLQTNETQAYYFPSNDRKSKFLPEALRFRYVGKYPVIKDTFSFSYQKKDWRDNMAFNNDILRVDGDQSAWIPVLYDVTNDLAYTEVRYDIEIECTDCEVLYINGSAPVTSGKARFKSDVPREMFLFLGHYNIQEAGGVTLLNTDFNGEQLAEFSALKEDISDFLAEYTGISYNERIYWVQGNVTSKDDAWSFVSYPTFITSGYPPHDLKSTFKDNYRSVFLQTISHELAHYYFGTLKNANSARENVINEGFAEFLSLKYMEHKGHSEYVLSVLDDKLDYVNDEDFRFEPMGRFKSLSQTNDRQTYAYDYQALILYGIEKEIGPHIMQKWIQLMLSEDKAFSDFNFFTETLKIAIGNDVLYDRIQEAYLEGAVTVSQVKRVLGRP